MDDALITVTSAAGVWDELRALSGWAGLVSILAMLAVTEYMRRVFATKEDVKLEKQHRETADEHRDERVHHLSEIVQQYIGKIDLMRDRMEERDRARERETAELREEVRIGFAKLEQALERRNKKERTQ